MARAKKTTTRKKKAAPKRAAAKKPTPRKAAARKATQKKTAAPKTQAPAPSDPKPRDPRLPPAGTVIEKTYKGKTLQVEVLEAGFRFEKKVWTSLTATAKEVTGAKSINGPLFFGIAKRASKAKEG